MVKIITDSSSDLPRDLLARHNIHVVPLSVRIGEEDYQEGTGITPEEFYGKMFSTAELPKTSQPSPAVFADAFKEATKEGEPAICFTISSGLSGTYQAALMGKELSGAEVEIFDTLGGSLGHGLQILKAVELAEAGYNVADIMKELYNMREKMNIFILLDNLENVVKGGRLSKFQGSVVKVLNIKIILEGIEGKIEVREKVRGNKRFLKKALEIIGERKKDFSDTIFGITHTGNFEDVEFIESQIEERFQPKQIIINYMGATMGTYAGRGGMIISFA